MKYVLTGLLMAGITALGLGVARADEIDRTLDIVGHRKQNQVDPDRGSTRTTRKQLDERQPQSTPAALRYSPGVYVQQTAHGQGSPYIRGRTGQQTVFLFDGLRLNHALFRQGPNQYLFTVDSRTLTSIDIIRGSASVDFGNDAIAGAVLLSPLEPKLDPGVKGFVSRPSMFLRAGSADNEVGGRLQLDMQFGGWVGVLLGVGGRSVGQLEAGGYAFKGGRAPNQLCTSITSVPCFESDGRTQLGTGFDELTSDGRVVFHWPETTLTLASYVYRQFDAPRTDQCPAPEAAKGQCLVMDEQFRTHVYAKVDAEPRWTFLQSFQSALGWQRQHQKHRLNRPDRILTDQIDTTTINIGRDSVDGVNLYFKGQSTGKTIGPITIALRYGLDGSFETVSSRAWIQFNEPNLTRALSRGRYVDGSRYTQMAAFISPSMSTGSFRIRAGIRASHIAADAPSDADSATERIQQAYTPVVFNGGLRWGGNVAFIVNAEQGFRAPNLDDLTARQSTGQGYQLENPNLLPEKAWTYEAGVRAKTRRFRGEIVGFYQTLDGAIERRLLTPMDCRLSAGFVDSECQANRAPLQLVNLSGTAVIYGFEGRARVRLHRALSLSGVVSYAFGEGNNPGDGDPKRVPLSRIPPLNGNVELMWRVKRLGLYSAISSRWASTQTRLSVGDVADARIPEGGTPGYVVTDLRFGHHAGRRLRQNLVLENLGDTRYRTHGSGVFGAGRSIVYSLELEM